jgi:hypothetical protein
MNVERLQKMAGVVRTGGKGTVRRQAAPDAVVGWLCCSRYRHTRETLSC